MTAATWVFLLLLTLLLGYQCDWTTQARYSFPVAFAWFCGGIILIFSKLIPKGLRISLGVAYSIPVAATLVAGALKPFIHTSQVPLPRSHFAASALYNTTNELEAYRFLEERIANSAQRHPQLIIANNPNPMNELLIPVVPWKYLEIHKKLMSSRPMIVWALLDSSSASALRSRLDEHFTMERVNTPENFPWEFLIISRP
jgi:hypothetical protein